MKMFMILLFCVHMVWSDLCGQDRVLLADWFLHHGSPTLLEDPLPQYVDPPDSNPYDDPSNPPDDPNPGGVCGMKWSDNIDSFGHNKYWLRNFANETECEEEGFVVTHSGHCGSCSSLQDLGVYLRQNLTDPTRFCGALGIISHGLMTNCLQRIGFSDNCIPIWEYNIGQTRQECWELCIMSWISGEANNKPDGSLNDCLQCDEDVSGPNFKFFSGRTRRNSGIPSAIMRPPEEFYDMEHCYWYGDLADPYEDSS